MSSFKEKNDAFILKYVTQMKNELSKFLVVYKKVMSNIQNNDIQNNVMTIEQIDYKQLIKCLGTYIFTLFNVNDWMNTGIVVGNTIIDLSIFKGTEYEKIVENFLLSLEKAFYSDCHDEILKAINALELDDIEKSCCLNYYLLMRKYGNVMKYKALSSNMEDKEFFEDLEKTLEFREFIVFQKNNIINYSQRVLMIENLVKMINDILRQPRKEVVVFD